MSIKIKYLISMVSRSCDLNPSLINTKSYLHVDINIILIHAYSHNSRNKGINYNDQRQTHICIYSVTMVTHTADQIINKILLIG